MAQLTQNPPEGYQAQIVWCIEWIRQLRGRLGSTGGGSIIQPADQIVYGTDTGVTSSPDFIYNESDGFSVGFNEVTTALFQINNTGAITTSIGDVGGINSGNGVSISDNKQVSIIGNVFGGNGNGTQIIVNDKVQLITITNVQEFASDALAISGGLVSDQIYKTTVAGVTTLCIVP